MEKQKRILPSVKKIFLEEWKSQPFSSVASLITISVAFWNFYISLPTLFDVRDAPPEMDFGFVLRLIFFVLLEGSLAYAFGAILVRLTEAGRGMPFMLMIITSIISAWVSGYNAFWMFVTATTSFDGALGAFIVGELAAFLIACYFIYHHYDAKKKLVLRINKEEGRGTSEYRVEKVYSIGFWIAFGTQLAAFFVIAINFGLKINPYIRSLGAG